MLLKLLDYWIDKKEYRLTNIHTIITLVAELKSKNDSVRIFANPIVFEDDKSKKLIIKTFELQAVAYNLEMGIISPISFFIFILQKQILIYFKRIKDFGGSKCDNYEFH